MSTKAQELSPTHNTPSSGALPVLVVDLDGTLLRSDMLHEAFWDVFARDWKTPFKCALALRTGKTALKRHLSQRTQIDIAKLPYNTDVLSHLDNHRKSGGRVALVTATHQDIAQQVADHLGGFDEVHGTCDTTNLKGSNKAAFLVSRFGEGNFTYMGDAEADLPVWQKAGEIVTVRASEDLRAKTGAFAKPVTHISPPRSLRSDCLRAMRPHQWLKNILVFLPILAAQQTDAITVTRAMLAFVAFSAIASGVYVLNDLLDLGPDRNHPRKKLRPFASGAVPIAYGGAMATGLLATGTVLAALLGWKFLGVMVGYFAMTTAYSLSLKRRLIIDICVLAGLYTSRIVAGGVATGIELSVWLLAFSIFFFFSLASVKRQAELVDMVKRDKLKQTGRGYHVDDLPIISMAALGAGYVSVLVMALYLNSPAVTDLYSQPAALWGICCILLYWLTRMVMMTHRGWMHDDPIVFSVRDRISQHCFALILLCLIAGSLW